ncbi:MAG: hypothetical protein LBQ20_12090 [Rhodanobacter sp.]|jgi:hypothetical protein|nr:hypothetical protein [Rhodanobacter sp.]
MFASDVGGATPTYASVKNADLGIGASLNGDVPFPADNAWNRDVSADPIDPNSDALIASIGLGTGLHPDFGADIPEGPIGIPYVVVSGSQQKVTINFTAYGEESDPGPYPIPGNAPIEGGANAPQGSDRHVLVIDRDNQKLYELFNAWPQNGGSWNADSGAVFDLTSNVVRPGGQPGWTSADAAGLPIFPGLVRYDEVASGAIHHALRFTVSRTRRAYVPPATHWASSNTDGNLPPMGMRVRLKASYPIPANVDPQTRVLLQALKTYGMIVADNGSNWFITGTSDQRWNNDALVPQLRSVSGSNFEVIRMDGLVTDGPAPQLLSPQAITGDWYDPAYDGSGFNVTMTPTGLILFYYGWDNSGHRLWLISDIGPTQIAPGTAITLNMNETVGGHFLTPATPSTLSKWGTLTLNFAADGITASATLDGNDGKVGLSLQKLAGMANTSSVTGDWYDPAYNGSGFNMLVAPQGLILFYYGWDSDGNRLWLISDVTPTQIVPGTPITLNMSQTSGGHFLAPAKPASTLSSWGTLKLDFSSCTKAIGSLTSTDGSSTVTFGDLQMIGGVMDMPPGC